MTTRTKCIINLNLTFLMAQFQILCTDCQAVLLVEGTETTNDDSSYIRTGRFLIYTDLMAAQANCQFHSTDSITNSANPTDLKEVFVNAEVHITNPYLIAELKARKDIYHSMINSTENFTFATLSNAQENFKMRYVAMDTIRYFNLSNKYTYFNEDNPAKSDSLYWKNGKIVPHFFSQTNRSNNYPFDAVNDLCRKDQLTKITYGECWGALVTSVWHGASKALDSTRFNNLVYSKVGLLDMDPDVKVKSNSSLNGASMFTKKVQQFSILIPGDWVYFKNHNYADFLYYYRRNKPDEYNQKTGSKIFSASGENALYLGTNASGEKLFAGLLHNQIEYLTELKMKTMLMNSYNNDLSIFWGNKNYFILDNVEISKILLDQLDEKINISRRDLLIIPD